MAAEAFFQRWSRRKAEARSEEVAGEAPALPVAAPGEEEAPAPTLEQVAQLRNDDDFRPFVARGVDETVRRAALKKLFADPHFNIMDGLDTYIEDYNRFEPLLPLVAAALNQAKDLIVRELTDEKDDDEPKDQDL